MADFEVVVHVFHALVGDLADVHQAVFAGHHGYDGADVVVQNLNHHAVVHLAHFHFCRDFFDAFAGGFHGFHIHGGDGDGAVVFNVDFGAGFGGEGADGFAAFADNVADFVLVNLHGEEARGVLRELLRAGHGGLHLLEDVQAGFFGLCQCNLHDFFGDALDFDVHLQGGNAFGGAGHFEVHVAEVVFVAQDVGEHGEFVAFQNQAHGNAGHMGFERHTGGEQAQAAAAHGGHGRRAVGFGDFRHHAHGVAEFFGRGQHAEQGAFG